jgi:soluble lytic murein transglycosylase
MRGLTAALLLAGLAVGCTARETAAPPSQLQTPAPGVSDPRAAFGEAHRLFRHGDFEHALPMFTVLVTTYPALQDYHLYFVGVSAARLGRGAEAQAALSQLLRDYPQSVKAPAAELEFGKLLLDDRARADEARALLQNALSAPDSATARGARLALAELDERTGNVAAAYEGFMMVRRDAVGSALGRTAKQHVLALRGRYPELMPAGADRLDEARLLVTEQDYAAAEAAAAQILEHPQGVDPAEAARVRADALYGQGKTEAALVALREVGDRYPYSAAAPAALFRLASVLWNRDEDAAALGDFEALRRRYPGAPQAPEALYAVGRIHQQAGRDNLAINSFADLAQRYPRSKLSAEARWRIGWIHYLSHNWPAAAATFSQLATRTQGREHDEAAYWYARSLDRAGRPAAARPLYQELVAEDPSGYYSMWAQQRLRSPTVKVDADTAPVTARSAPVAAVPLQPATEPRIDGFHLQRSKELQAAGVYSLAREELAAIERTHRTDTATLRYLLQAFQAVDGYAAAVRLARELHDGAGLSPQERDQFLYPLAFWTTVRRQAEAQGIDPLLVLAVMRQESLFDPEARSAADARGLMQLLPGTARRVAGASSSAVDASDLNTPEVNIRLGTQYLRMLLDQFHDEPLKAVAAYNGGENAVEKWERQSADLEPDEFVESITFRETRDYVKRVVANYQMYQHLYGAP